MLTELKDKTIGVLSGGVSNEREVSLRSGKNVYRMLSQVGYKVVLLDLTTKEELFSLLENNKIDVVFNTLHGEFGEDGELQALLNYKGIKYTGCNMQASSLGMNKLHTKLVAKGLGLTVANYKQISCGSEFKKEEVPFSFPWVIKPMNGGSSLDTHFIKSEKDLQAITLRKNIPYLIEELLEGTEVTSGVIGYEKDVIALPILQLKPSNEFYDYEAKYTEGKTEFIIPAEIPLDVENIVKKSSLLMHNILGAMGATRCDFIIKNNVPYLLEINTSSGMTELSDIPSEAKAYGLSEEELCDKILLSALQKGL